MKFAECPNCGADVEVQLADKDGRGWHTSCPSCEGSFDIDVEDFLIQSGTPVKLRDGKCGFVSGNEADKADLLGNVLYIVSAEDGCAYSVTKDMFTTLKDWRLTRRFDERVGRVCHYPSNQEYSNVPCYNCCDRGKCNADLFERLAQYEDTGMKPDIVAEYKKFEDELVENGLTLSKVLYLIEKYIAGEVAFLPCKVGDTLYRVCVSQRNRQSRAAIFVRPVILNENNFWRIVFGGEYGKTVFSTEPEAKKKAASLGKEVTR